MPENRPTFFQNLKVFFLQIGAHWREFNSIDLAVILIMIGLGAFVAHLSGWVLGASAFWVVTGVVAVRLWKAEYTAFLGAREALLNAEVRLALRSRLDALHVLLEEGWRLEPLVLHLPTKKGWPVEKLRAVIERVGKPVQDWQFRVRQELELNGLDAVPQWDAAADPVANEPPPPPMSGLMEPGEAAEQLREVVRIRLGYFRRVPLLKNIVASARSQAAKDGLL